MKILRFPTLLLLTAAVLLSACGEDENDFNLYGGGGNSGKTTPSSGGTNANKNDATKNALLARMEMPKIKAGSIIVTHTAVMNAKTQVEDINYTVEWDPTLHAQRWSCYEMCDNIVKTPSGYAVNRYSGDRTGNIITPESAYPNDAFLAADYHFTADPYWGTGYDHGHICPSADRLASTQSNYQTFFLTNMQPQVNAFNAGIWSQMEQKVRNWSNAKDTLYVCKGGTIDNADNIIKYLGSGKNKIPVPKYFFMALLCKNSMGYKALGFWIKHDGTIDKNTSLANYVVNIRELEALTDIDFFCNLPDETEEHVETLDVASIKSAWGLK
ncbi:MAG: DNA/RNA non-specific endonuclease [Prevotella sp.]|nr:DNA/RNA non-specific endonuclease [Prevotella sp.]